MSTDFVLIPSEDKPNKSPNRNNDGEARRGRSRYARNYGTSVHHDRTNDDARRTRSEDGDNEYSESRMGFVGDISRHEYDNPHNRSNPYHVTSMHHGDIHSRYGSGQQSMGMASSSKEQQQNGSSGSNSNGSSGSQFSLENLASLAPMLEGVIGNAFSGILGNITGGGNMSQDALGTAALAALVGRNDGGTGGLGSGIAGGALGALLLGALAGRGFGGFGAGPADAVVAGTAAIETQLAINNAVSALKDNNLAVKGDVAELFAQNQQAEVLRGIDDKIAALAAHHNTQVGHLTAKLEEVQSFLTLQQKDAEIHALRSKTEDYAQQLSEQRLANMLKHTHDHVSVQVRNSHDSIHNTVRAILPLLVPAAAGGGNNIPVDRVTQIVNALASFGDMGHENTSNNINIRS